VPLQEVRERHLVGDAPIEERLDRHGVPEHAGGGERLADHPHDHRRVRRVDLDSPGRVEADDPDPARAEAEELGDLGRQRLFVLTDAGVLDGEGRHALNPSGGRSGTLPTAMSGARIDFALGTNPASKPASVTSGSLLSTCPPSRALRAPSPPVGAQRIGWPRSSS
jgi:hypothetical protein